MYVKSIVIDGFKSYGNRTEITGFDKEFNAITGLNGTGKSNILDAICFVLGISNLSNVRAASLQELIYKNGQSGVTKATVSITFDNTDKSQSPVGYQDCNELVISRQVIMGGKNKYLLNGTNVQAKRIQDLFCSIQLNVNNPHFLIMQGRITKVLNMKPAEILGMIEEAAGTKMYENKRTSAQKTIEKKEGKLQEIDTLINEEINPKLTKLREERQAYHDFQNLERHLQHLKIKYIAWQYLQAQKQGAQAKNQLEQAEQIVKDLEAKAKTAKDRCDVIDKEVEEHQNKDDGTGEKFKELELQCKEKEKLHTKAKSEARAANDNVVSEEKKLKQLEKALAQDEKALVSKKQEMEVASDEFERLREADRVDSEQLALAQKRLEALHAGMDIDEEGNAATLHEQLMSAREAAKVNSTQAKQHKMKLDFNRNQLRDKKQQMNGCKKAFDRDQVQVETMKKNLTAAQNQLNKLNFDEGAVSDLNNRRQAIHKELRSIQDRLEYFDRRNPLVDFKYTNPEPNWNKKRVHGVVCNLIKLKNEETARALETAAGGKLFNVVVDTDITGKKLLQNGQLRHRTTFIPLNKISGNAIHPQVVNLAQKLAGKENIQPALSLIEYSGEVHSAMEYVFGSTFICRNMEIAASIAFDERIKCRCVTWDGDVCDPSGNLSGGAVPDRPAIFTELKTINEERNKLNKLNIELQNIDKKLNDMNEMSNKYRATSRQLEIMQHEYKTLTDSLANTQYGRLQQEVETLEQQIGELEEQIKVAEKNAKDALAKVADLEKKVNDSKGGKQQQIKETEKLLALLKKKAAASQQQWNKREQEYESRKLEIADLEKSIETGRTQIETSKALIEELKQKLNETNDLCSERLEDVKKAQNELKELKHLMNMKNKEIQKKIDMKQKLLNEISEIELEIKKQNHVVEEMSKKYHEVSSAERRLEKEAKMDEKVLNEARNMSDKEGRQLGDNISKSQEQRNKMARTINLKAQSMFDQEEKSYNLLIKRKKTIDLDKRKFLKLLEEIDQKKTEALKKACEQISRDFGSIFGTLLPGSNSKLEPPVGKSLLDGLEIKVSLGGIWRESLSELSGGQKSLIALSLILAMLLYKPAPLYILDEVDAALDLNHTQNIGNMLKKHFKRSQFIIVSLKDGMFSNANVLFRTKFVDGMSAVQRTVNTNNRH